MTTTGSTTATARFLRPIATMAALLLAVPGCAGPAAATTQPLTSDLGAALLTVDDVPAGFAATTAPPTDRATSSRPECSAILDALEIDPRRAGGEPALRTPAEPDARAAGTAGRQARGQ